MKKTNPKSQTRISKITVARLYNLGNYEHVRYELTVDVPEGESARTALRNTMLLLKAANPKPPVSTQRYNHAKEFIAAPEKIATDITCKKSRAKYLKEVVAASKKEVAEYEAWLKQRDRAMELLDRMGGATTHTDAKNTWEDCD